MFATGHDQSMKQLGAGLAAPIRIDATMVRAVLLPATMKLAGVRNLYRPRWLNWLPTFEQEPDVCRRRLTLQLTTDDCGARQEGAPFCVPVPSRSAAGEAALDQFSPTQTKLGQLLPSSRTAKLGATHGNRG